MERRFVLKVSRSLRPGRGSVVRMEVADSSGEIQVSTFDAVDELFARVKKGKAVQVHPLLHDPAPTLHSTLHSLYTHFMLSTLQIPLTASTIQAKNVKWKTPMHLAAEENAIDKLEPKKGVRFAAANGGAMGKYGRKYVQFEPVDTVFTGQA